MNIFARRLAFLGTTAVLTLAACGGSAPTPRDSPTDGAASQRTNLEGDIVISGSSTVGPISTGVAELFNEQNPSVAISIDEPGTGDGFALFCEGQTDLQDASRPIDEEEIAACEAAGIDYVELKVALDGIGVITSAANTAGPECLTFPDLYALTGPESLGINNWNDGEAIASELGSSTDLPDAELTITAPGEESGTYDFFVETIVEVFGESRGIPEDQWALRPDYQPSADDNVIIEGVAGTPDNPTTLGFVGFAYVENALDRVTPLQVDGGEGCVEVTPETIADGSYPIARDLFIYVNRAKAAENPALAAFVDFYLANGTLEQVFQLPTAAYVQLAGDAFAETVSAWQSR